MDFLNSVLWGDLEILRDRLDLDPDVYADPHNADRIIVRWAHADDPWLEYEGVDRAPSDVSSPAWQRDQPFWFILDQAEKLTDAQLVGLWEAAANAHGLVKDTNRMVRLGLSAPTTDEEDMKIWVDGLTERGHTPADLGFTHGTH